MSSGWHELMRPGADTVTVDGHELRAGSRVRLRPRPGGDLIDTVLAGRVAVIESVQEDLEGHTSLAVVIEDDPGYDLGLERMPGHRFFFAPAEVEPVAPASAGARILVAGIGNVFLGDDGWGVALAARLGSQELAPGVELRDFGIRGLELAFAMQDGFDAVVLLDATPRGCSPGTLYVIEVDPGEADAGLDAHGMDPLKVLGLVRSMGATPPPTYVIGCEPLTRMSAEDPELLDELSEPVRSALDRAIPLVQSLLQDLRHENHVQEVTPP